MIKTVVTAVFDIGKTNKKFFLFDHDYNEVYREYVTLEEIEDEDGHPTEDLSSLTNWIKETFDKALSSDKYKIESLNFSTYGASLVHLDREGNVLTPLYNYTKPIPQTVLDEYYHTYGSPEDIATETASPQNGALNSGLQLYWIKKTKPDLFNQIKYSLHFPQYLSHLYLGIPLCEYTSIGCHTNLWNYKNNTYHQWVTKESIDDKFPNIVSTSTTISTSYKGQKIKVGVGIHDSSAALIPYLKYSARSFLLISTGTWSITLNPFNKEILTKEDLANDCLNYMRINGDSVKASRFFMGNEYKNQVDYLNKHFHKDDDFHLSVKFDKKIYIRLISQNDNCYRFKSILLSRQQPSETNIDQFENYKVAYHQLLKELVDLQMKSIDMSIGDTKAIKQIYLDGGFASNDVFLNMVTYQCSNYEIKVAETPLGSALGAAMVISKRRYKGKLINTRMISKVIK